MVHKPFRKFMFRIPAGCVGLTALAVLALWNSQGLAQKKKAAGKVPPPAVPFFDGSAFVEQFFRPGNAQEHEQLAGVEIPFREEQEYGERVLQSFLDDFKRRNIAVSTKGRDVEYLKKLVETLRPQLTNRDRYRTVRVLLADTETPDAYSIPGGTLIFFRGMVEIADSEAALVGVIGHELAHLDRGHQLAPLKRNKLARQNAQAAAGDPLAMFRQANVFMSAFLRPFRPEDEQEADRDGVTWAYRAGYDPRAMLALFAALQERDQQRAPGRDQLTRMMPAFLRSHPHHADRAATIEDLYRQLQESNPRADLYLGRSNIRRRIPMSERRFDD